jgi:hypothetical protein
METNNNTLTCIQEIYFDVCDRLRGLPVTEIGYWTNKDMLEEFKWKLERIEKHFKQLADIPDQD